MLLQCCQERRHLTQQLECVVEVVVLEDSTVIVEEGILRPAGTGDGDRVDTVRALPIFRWCRGALEKGSIRQTIGAMLTGSVCGSRWWCRGAPHRALLPPGG